MKRTKVFFAAMIPLVLGLSVQATSLQFDFGPATVTGADALLSPGHYIGAIPAGETSWNKLTADSGTLVYGNGAAATGISVDIGMEFPYGIINLTSNQFNATLAGTVINGGVYTNTSPAKDGIFGLATATATNRAIGLRVNGLAAGTYTIYLVGRNHNTATESQERFYAKVGPSDNTFDYLTGSTSAVALNPSPALTNGFVNGNNFATLTATLAAGESLYLAAATNGLGVPAESRGFFNCVQIYFGVPVLPARISAQPAPLLRTVNEGVTVTLTAGVAGDEPITRQWKLNGTNAVASANVTGVDTNTLRLIRAPVSLAGTYALTVTNSVGGNISSNVVVAVNPVFNTAQVSNIWNLLPGDRYYISAAGDTERGIAYNAVTTNLLVVSRNPTSQVVVVDGLTGAEKHFLDVNPGIINQGTFTLSTIGVADDGAVYAANLTTGAAGLLMYRIYRWADDSSSAAPSAVFIGDPGLGVESGLRYGDTFAIRGAGADTQILVPPGTGTNVVLLRTMDATDFQTQIPPLVISVSNAVANFARRGIAFGPGTNTFWAKNSGGLLYLVEFDVNTGKGFVKHSYSAAQVPSGLTGLATDRTNLLAGVSLETAGDNVRIYGVEDLVVGPVLRDQETYETVNANPQLQNSLVFGNDHLYALDSNNGIKAFKVNYSYVPPSVTMVAHPTNRTVMAGRPTTFYGLAASPDAIAYQWRYNVTNIIGGATSNFYFIASVATNHAGTYTLFASNANGSVTSSNALLTVVPVYNTPVLSNIWELLPGSRPYLSPGNNNERGLAYNKVTTNLVIAGRDPERVAVLDAMTGAELRFLDVTGIPPTVPGASLGINTIGVADDGVVYAVGLSVTPATTPVNVFRWPNDDAGNPPYVAFSGDPGSPVQPNIRWSDQMTLRGAGTNTQILLTPGAGTNVAFLQTTDGINFTSTIIPISGVPNSFAQRGVTFGPGTNTFWGKDAAGALFLVKFDLGAGTGTAIYSSSGAFPALYTGIAADPTGLFLAGVAIEAGGENVRLYSLHNTNAGPILMDQEPYATQNANQQQAAALAFGGEYLFALDVNNGVKAFKFNAVIPVAPFSISSVVQQGSSIVFTWPTVSGHSYQVQYHDIISGVNWSNVGSAISGTGGTVSFTNSASIPSSRFFRIEAQ